MICYFSDDDEFFDLPSDLPSDGELTPTNETINNGGSLSSTNISNSNGNGNLVEKALERLGPSMSVPNNFHYQIYPSYYPVVFMDTHWYWSNLPVLFMITKEYLLKLIEIVSLMFCW